MVRPPTVPAWKSWVKIQYCSPPIFLDYRIWGESEMSLLEKNWLKILYFKWEALVLSWTKKDPPSYLCTVCNYSHCATMHSVQLCKFNCANSPVWWSLWNPYNLSSAICNLFLLCSAQCAVRISQWCFHCGACCTAHFVACSLYCRVISFAFFGEL